MNSVNISLENCYGIGELTHNFTFNTGSKSYSVYAPNGFMKTSLAKTLMNMADAQDLIHPERSTVCNVTDENGDSINQDNILVIEPYKEKFNSNKTSLLLANSTIKDAYDEALLKIDKKTSALLKSLKERSGLKSKTITPEFELLTLYSQDSLLNLLESLQTEINSSEEHTLSDLSYNSLFNSKNLSLLKFRKN